MQPLDLNTSTEHGHCTPQSFLTKTNLVDVQLGDAIPNYKPPGRVVSDKKYFLMFLYF